MNHRSTLEWADLRIILRDAIDDPIVSNWFSTVIKIAEVHPPVNSWTEVLDQIADGFTDNAYVAVRRRDRKRASSWHALATEAQVTTWVEVLLRDLWPDNEKDLRPTMPDDVLRHLRTAILQTNQDQGETG